MEEKRDHSRYHWEMRLLDVVRFYIGKWLSGNVHLFLFWMYFQRLKNIYFERHIISSVKRLHILFWNSIYLCSLHLHNSSIRNFIKMFFIKKNTWWSLLCTILIFIFLSLVKDPLQHCLVDCILQSDFYKITVKLWLYNLQSTNLQL